MHGLFTDLGSLGLHPYSTDIKAEARLLLTKHAKQSKKSNSYINTSFAHNKKIFCVGYHAEVSRCSMAVLTTVLNYVYGYLEVFMWFNMHVLWRTREKEREDALCVMS
jgi:hypothetical protein